MIDDIKVTAATDELIPPAITLSAPIIPDTVNTTGPFTVNADITDASGIDTAYLVYTVNNGAPATIPMTLVSGNTYTCQIPSYAFGDTVCYYIEAVDNSSLKNTGKLPSGGCYTFFIKKGPATIDIGTGTTATYYSPIYVSSSSSSYKYNYHASLYTAAELNNIGDVIESIAWNKTTGGYTAGNATYKIYLKHTTATTVPDGFTDFTDELSNATLVYTSTTQNIPTTAGWYTFDFNASTFSYNGADNLLVFVVFYRPDNATGGIYHYRDQLTGKAITFYGASSDPSGSYKNNRPHIRIGFMRSNEAIDAGVYMITEPQGSVLANTSLPVKAYIKNYGTDTLKKTTVKWTLDDTLQTPFSWTGSLLQDMASSLLDLGNINLTPGPHSLKAWTELPNDSIDQKHVNDTARVNLYACESILNGSYTVGKPTSDFKTIDEAITRLNNCGISGPVVFNIEPGTYNQQIVLSEVNGASLTNTITFQSSSGDPDSVVITYASTGSTDNYVANFKGGDYFIIKNLTLKATGLSYSKVLVFGKNTTYNKITGNKIIGVAGTNTGTNNALIYSSASLSSLDSNNTFENNTLFNGSYGFYLYGGSETVLETGTRIINNRLIGQYNRAIELKYQDAPVIESNLIEVTTARTTFRGIYVENCDNDLRIQKNKISIANSGYGIYVYKCDGVSGEEGLTANNFVYVGGTSSAYGIYSSTSTNQKIYYNSANITSTASTARAFYLTGTSSVELRNNIFAYAGSSTSGMAIYINATSGITSSNYNNFYSTGTNLGYWSGNQANLAAWQTASSQDTNSYSVDPVFATYDNLHINNADLDGKATPITLVTDDIDGESRHVTTPDIGADEFTLTQNDAAIVALVEPDKPCPGYSASIKVKVKNMGHDTLFSVTVNWSVQGSVQTPYNITNDTILPQSDKDYVIGSYTFSSGVYDLKFWTTNPNGVADENTLNDTLLIVDFKSAIAGTYTIGGTNPDYASFADAIADLQTSGVCGPATFNVAAGTYNEQLLIYEIPGASATNTITFQSATGDSTSVVLAYASTSSGDFIVELNGADYITFKQMTFEFTYANTNYAYIINMDGGRIIIKF